MNASTTDLRPEVTAFVTRVRECLADLSDDEREELVGGLEADLAEQLADGGVLVLSDPARYAAELRTAAGLPEARRRWPVRRPHGSAGEHVTGMLDDARRWWLALAQRHHRADQAWGVVEAMRPAWWVLRAWVAVTLLDQMAGDWESVTLLPTLGVPGLGPAVLLAAVVLSVLIGQGRLWPGSGPERPLPARLVLVALNVLAVAVPLTLALPGQHQNVYVSNGYLTGYHDGSHRPGLRIGTDVVRNIYAYDAEGHPLQGVQLYDQAGRPVAVSPASSMGEGRERSVTCPWFNGTTPLFNVFPLQQRTQRWGSCLSSVDPEKVGAPGFREPPLASVPPVSLAEGTAPSP